MEGRGREWRAKILKHMALSDITASLNNEWSWWRSREGFGEWRGVGWGVNIHSDLEHTTGQKGWGATIGVADLGTVPKLPQGTGSQGSSVTGHRLQTSHLRSLLLMVHTASNLSQVYTVNKDRFSKNTHCCYTSHLTFYPPLFYFISLKMLFWPSEL